jgi:hypothetical protein
LGIRTWLVDKGSWDQSIFNCLWKNRLSSCLCWTVLLFPLSGPLYVNVNSIFSLWLTINRRSSDLFPIGPPKST